MKNILLVEPDYQNKFPPLGLLKIATYHKSKGDSVSFFKGKLKQNNVIFDRVYITTLFSFYHSKTIETILHYKKMVNGNLRRLFVGGIYASLKPEVIYEETGIYPHVGLLDKSGTLGDDGIIVDSLIPDYDLLKDTQYDYDLKDNYFGYATRGCPNKCVFCSVSKLEPEFKHYLGLKEYVSKIKQKYGEKQNLILFDNNILASNEFKRIINDIRDLGFEKRAKLNNKLRAVDFNQGIDARLINDAKAELLSTICIKPLRIAFDDLRFEKIYREAVKTMASKGVLDLSNYILFNFNDKPTELYRRLEINIKLNENLGTKIYSFPMRYTPLDVTDRSFIGQHWNKKQIRGVQCILNVTKGLVGPRSDFFYEAFGENENDFQKLILMPENYIMNRFLFKDNLSKEWKKTFDSLTTAQTNEFVQYVADNNMEEIQRGYVQTSSAKVKRLLEHYLAHNIDKRKKHERKYGKSYQLAQAI